MIARTFFSSSFLAAALVAAACTSSSGGGAPDASLPPTDCAAGYLGDANKPIELSLIAVKADGTTVPLKDGDDLAVILPPQGGRVSFVGVRATNLDGCGLQLLGSMRDTSSQQLRSDGRTVNLTATGDGWGTTGSASTNVTDVGAISNFTNIPLCPNQWSDRDVFDVPYQVELGVKDRRGKTASVKLSVVPRCSEPGKEAGCRCICKKGYVLGESCGLDGGADGGV